MKKLLKLLPILLSALLLVLLLTACGDKEPPAADSGSDAPQSPQSDTADPGAADPGAADPGADEVQSNGGDARPSGSSAWLATRTGKYYSQFENGTMCMEYEADIDGTTTKFIAAFKSGKTYLSVPIEGEQTVMITDDSSSYMIYPDQKMVIKCAPGSVLNVFDVALDESRVDLNSLITGTREVDGKVYDTESWDESDAVVTLCFEGDRLAYIIGESDGSSTVIKVLKASADVSDSLFEIPADYQIVG